MTLIGKSLRLVTVTVKNSLYRIRVTDWARLRAKRDLHVEGSTADIPILLELNKVRRRVRRATRRSPCRDRGYRCRDRRYAADLRPLQTHETIRPRFAPTALASSMGPRRQHRPLHGMWAPPGGCDA